MAFTVTATQSGSSSLRGVYLQVEVLTGATEAGGANTVGTSATGATAQGSLTPNGTNSLPVFAISGDGTSGNMPAAATSNTYYNNNGDSADGWSVAEGYYSGTVTAATPITVGAGSAGAGFDHTNWAIYEILSSGGSTPAVDGSTPVLALTMAAATITTASFAPPAGSVLVAIVTAGGTGTGAGISMAITDTSGLGLTWTPRAVSSSSDAFQPCWVYTTTIGAAPTGVVLQVGTPGTVVTQSGSNTGTVTGAFSGTQPRTAGDLLVAVVTAYGTTSAGAISNTGATWTQQVSVTGSSVAETTIWTRVATGADANPTFTATMAGTAASERMTCFLIELTGQHPLLPIAATGTNSGTIAGTLTVTTGQIVPRVGCYAVSGWNIVSASNTTTWTPGASWSNASTTGATTAVDHAMCDTFQGVPGGVTLAEIGTHGVTSTFESGAILVVRSIGAEDQTITLQAVKRASLW